MRYPVEETAEKHERIVRIASELFRERGFDDVTVAEVMKAAGLTHGAFYSHFASKEALMAAAVEYGMETTLAGIKKNSATAKSRAAYLDRYLSPQHRDNPSQGCTMSALSGDIRNQPEVRSTFSTELTAILKAMEGNRGDAIFTTAAMVGAMILARAGDDDVLSREILREVRTRLNPKR